jgi:hypothetical protein
VRLGVAQFAVVVVLGASSAFAALPPGHPSVAAPSESALPPGHPPVSPTEDESEASPDSDDAASETQGMPPGHPATDGESPKDRLATAPDLPRGTIEVHVADPNQKALSAVQVRLAIMRQDVATGNSKQEQVSATDGNGVVAFHNMPNGTDFSYRASVQQGDGVFATEPFRLDERAGERVLLHVYPVTRDIRQALVGMRGVVYVQPREDIFQIETTIQVLNIGAVAWVPDQVKIPLPDGAKAFRTSESMSDARVERDKDGPVLLLGTFSPGEHEVTFQYQLDNAHEPTLHFRMGLPPHMAEMRVYAEGPRDLQLNVSGFPKAEHTTGQTGGHLLITGKRAARGEPALDEIDVSLENLPVPAQGRWYAAFLALGLAAVGVWNGLSGRRSKTKSQPYRAEIAEAEELVFRELIALEKLEREGQVGPRAYAEARTEMLDVLSRLAVRGARAAGART